MKNAHVSVYLASNDASLYAEVNSALARDFEVQLLGAAEDQRWRTYRTVPPLSNVVISDSQVGFPPVLSRLQTFLNTARTLQVCEAVATEFTEDLFARGCWGVVSRSELPRDLAKAVRAVASGELWVGRRMLASLLGRAWERDKNHAAPFATSLGTTLTEREKMIASFAVQGLMNKEIARALNISDKTVKTHMSHILKKGGVARRQQLGTPNRVFR